MKDTDSSDIAQLKAWYKNLKSLNQNNPEIIKVGDTLKTLILNLITNNNNTACNNTTEINSTASKKLDIKDQKIININPKGSDYTKLMGER